MAEMIPDRLPSGASAGERRVFALLQDLPDDVIVYYEPVLADRYPDFVAILPSIGVLVIEVKGWYPSSIERADGNEVVITGRSREIHPHPVRQARDYKLKLMEVARRHRETAMLLEHSGPHEGKFVFPFGHVAILNNCTREQLDERGLSAALAPGRVFARDEFDAVTASADPLDGLMTGFDPWWPFEPLSGRRIAVLRAIIHPEIVLSPPAPPAVDDTAAGTPSLQVLDVRQERNAHLIGEGHRIVYGIAGSGKTVILVARARLLAEDPARRVLILCYNRMLAMHFQAQFAATRNVACLNFHQWAVQRNGIAFDRGEDEDAFGARLLKRLERGKGEAHCYDAVFIDEAQDFPQSWFQCARLALKEPDDGDLLIVGDGSQALYRRRRFTWAQAGVNAVGRTINRRLDLDRNYRNTQEILKIAAAFVGAGTQGDPEARLQIIRPDPGAALRSGPAPQMLAATEIDDEIRVAVDTIAAWLADGLRPADIAVLFRANANPTGWVRDLAVQLSARTAVYWPSEGFRDPEGVRITTMHAAKGLQWRAVVVMRTDTVPFTPERDADPDEQERLERGLMYVAMTRAEERLTFTRSTLHGFAAEIERLLMVA